MTQMVGTSARERRVTEGAWRPVYGKYVFDKDGEE